MKADWGLAGAFLSSHPREAARIVERADPDTGAAVLSHCPPRVIAAALRQMDPAEGGAVLARLPAELTPGVLSELPLGVAALMLRRLELREHERLLAAARPETARSLRTALKHPEATAGSLMDGDVLALPPEIDAGEARRRLRERSRKPGKYVYVVDGERRPVGVVGLAELMLAPPKASLAALMRSSVERLSAWDGTDRILAHPGWRELHALPVVDAGGVLVGALRRETCERLRAEAAERAAAGTGGFGLELAELFWTLIASAVDELGARMQPHADRPPGEGADAD